MASEKTKAALRDELKGHADNGAGLVELLDHLEASNRRLRRWHRLSTQEVEDLSLYCWSLKSNGSKRPLWSRSGAFWDGFKGTASSGRPGRRRAA